MFKTRVRKILRDVWARKGRTLLVSTAIFIGVAGVVALVSLSLIIVGQLQEDIKQDELAMLEVFVSVDAEAELDNERYLELLEAVPGVTAVQMIVQQPADYAMQPDTKDFDEVTLTAYYEPPGELSLEPMRLIEGAYPGAGEFVVEKRSAEALNLQVGDVLYFRVLSPEAENDIESRTISGIVFHPYAFGNANLYGAAADVNYITGTTGYTTFAARFEDFEIAEAQSREFSSVLANETPYRPVFSQLEDPAQNSLITGALTISGTMSFLAILALLVSGFLVINVISSVVVEQKRQIGIMKSIGATYGDTVFMYAGIALMYGVIGVIPGVLVGVPVGNLAAHELAPQVNTSLEGFQYAIPAIIIGILMGLLVPVLASLIPVALGTRVRILNAITDLGIDASYGSGPLARIIEKLPIPITIRQGLSNVSLKKSRLFFTVITLSIAAGAFMGIFWVFDSLTGGINLYLDSFNVEIGVFPTEGRDPEEIVPLLQANFAEGDDAVISRIEPGFQYQISFQGYEPVQSTGGPPLLAYGYDIASERPAFNFTVTEGDPLTEATAENGVILSSLIAANMEKTIGDQVVLQVPGSSAELTVVGIVEYPLEQVWIDWRTLARITGYVIGAPRPNDYLTTLTIEGSGNDPVTVGGFDTTISSFLTFAEGAYFTPGEPEVIITESLAESGGYAVNDSLTLVAENGATLETTITGIVELDPEQIAMMAGEDGASTDLIAMDWQQLAALEGRSLEGRPMPQAYFLITTLDDPTTEELDAIIEEMEVVMLDQGIPTQFANFVSIVEQINQGFSIFRSILQLVAGLIALVGALGLLTTLSMSVFERQKEIGVMRSIGAGSSTIALQFMTEGLVVGIIAWLVGIPLGYLIQVLLLDVTGFSETFPILNPLEGITGTLIALIGMIVITLLASILPSLSAARKTVSEILRYQ